jgi:hypothetical protein
MWVTLGLAFGVFVYHGYEGQWFGLGTAVDVADGLVNDGAIATEKYLTGYVVEKSLSVDNIFVIAMISGLSLAECRGGSLSSGALPGAQDIASASDRPAESRTGIRHLPEKLGFHLFRATSCSTR